MEKMEIVTLFSWYRQDPRWTTKSSSYCIDKQELISLYSSGWRGFKSFQTISYLVVYSSEPIWDNVCMWNYAFYSNLFMYIANVRCSTGMCVFFPGKSACNWDFRSRSSAFVVEILLKECECMCSQELRFCSVCKGSPVTNQPGCQFA